MPEITVFYPCNKETPICFETASKCWQLLHSNDVLQIDFGRLLMNLPMAVKSWLNRFLVDLAVYLGRNEEALNILKDSPMSNLEKNLRNLSLTVSQPTFTVRESSIFFGHFVFHFSLSIFRFNRLTFWWKFWMICQRTADNGWKIYQSIVPDDI